MYPTLTYAVVYLFCRKTGFFRQKPHEWVPKIEHNPLSKEAGVECDKKFQSGNRRKIFIYNVTRGSRREDNIVERYARGARGVGASLPPLCAADCRNNIELGMKYERLRRDMLRAKTVLPFS